MGEIIEDIISAINSVGFPIVMCFVIMYYWNVQFIRITEKISDSVSQLKDVVVENTKVIEMLKEELEVIK